MAKQSFKHKSFRRSYREDYACELEVPGILSHIAETFRTIFKNWRIFFPLILLAVVFNIALVGIMSEDTYVEIQETLSKSHNSAASGQLGNFAKSGLLLVATITRGGLLSGFSEAQIIFLIISFLLIWLIVIYLLRHLLAKKTITLRDALYNALGPLISTFLVFLVGAFESLPIFIVSIMYSSALKTEFLSTPFYALLFIIFAASLILLSLYLLSSTFIALIAVSAPGIYPAASLHAANELVAGHRVKILTRLLALVVSVIIFWVVIMLPLMTIDLYLKTRLTWLSAFPFIPICLLILVCFTYIYITTYLYLFYRRVLDREKSN